MHAANLLNKRRQAREEHTTPKIVPEHRDSQQHHRSVSRKTNSQTSFLESIAAGACSTPTGSSAPRIPTVSESQYRPVIGPKQGNPGQQHQQRNGTYSDGYYHYPAEPVILYHKPERISCAHIGLCVMIGGTILTIIAGFIGYLLGFGEPGVIIGCGGGIITVVGLILLCCGNRWHLDEKTFGKKIPILSLPTTRASDLESGNLRRTEGVGDKLEVSKLPKLAYPRDPISEGKVKQGLFSPVLEIDLVSEPEPSGGTTETEAEELK